MPGNDSWIGKDRRWAARRGVALDADLTSAEGMSCPVRITDISEEGCQIRTPVGQEPERESLYQIKITGMEALTVYVAWTADGKAGLTFTTPQTAATIESLVMKSLYARLSRTAGRAALTDESLPPLGPFPFED